MAMFWGITEADIQGITKEDVETTDTKEIDPEIFQEVETELNEIFCHNDSEHAFINELFRLCTLRKTRQKSGEIIRDE
jgi:hypothetical protein